MLYKCQSCFFFQAEDGIRDKLVTGVQTCALPIYGRPKIFLGKKGFDDQRERLGGTEAFQVLLPKAKIRLAAFTPARQGSRRSEERRVGKECRSRLSAYN